MDFELSAQQHLLPPAIFLAILAVGMELQIAYFLELFKSPWIPVLVFSILFAKNGRRIPGLWSQ